MRWPNDIRLAREVSDIDMILGGHDHEYGVKDVEGKLFVFISASKFNKRFFL